MTIVLDLDDTISVHRNRDFANAVPVIPTIKKLRHLKEDGWKIVIYSARGQNSCAGDLTKIEEKYRAQIESWLAKHDVPYDRLVFGKPLGDVYVDDKGISLDEFLSDQQERLKGNSGADIYRIGRYVIKECKDAQDQADWYAEAKQIGVDVPRVYSVVLGKLYMEHIPGKPGSARELSSFDLFKIVSEIFGFSYKLADRDGNNYLFDTEALVERARGHLAAVGAEDTFESLFRYVGEEARELCRKNSSFCHGDMSLSNIIFGDDGNLYYIDPIVQPGLSSFLLDLAKIRFSLDGGEKFLHGKEPGAGYEAARRQYDDVMTAHGLIQPVTALEATYWLRLLKYTDRSRVDQVIRKAKELEQRL